MFSSVLLENVAAFESLEWTDHQGLNLIIGENDTGKTHLLKLLYSIARSVSDFQTKKQGPKPMAWKELLAEKLLWTFQPQNFELGKLVRKGQKSLKIEARFCDENLHFGFGEKTTKKISDASNNLDSVDFGANAIFLPPKEILTAFNAIAATRESMEIEGFDDTYLDLIRYYRLPPTQGNVAVSLIRVLDSLSEVTGGGRIEEEKGEFVFHRGNERFSMSQTAEGIKKIGIFNRLILNRTFRKKSLLFVDEPETALHPKAVVAMADMLFELAQHGSIQVYVSTHSFFFLKRIEQLAREHDRHVPLVDLRREKQQITARFHDLRQGLPDNPIIETSLRLLDADLELDWR